MTSCRAQSERWREKTRLEGRVEGPREQQTGRRLVLSMVLVGGGGVVATSYPEREASIPVAPPARRPSPASASASASAAHGQLLQQVHQDVGWRRAEPAGGSAQSIRGAAVICGGCAISGGRCWGRLPHQQRPNLVSPRPALSALCSRSCASARAHNCCKKARAVRATVRAHVTSRHRAAALPCRAAVRSFATLLPAKAARVKRENVLPTSFSRHLLLRQRRRRRRPLLPPTVLCVPCRAARAPSCCRP